MDTIIHRTIVKNLTFLDAAGLPAAPEKSKSFVGYIADRPFRGEMSRIDLKNRKVLIGVAWYTFIPSNLEYLVSIPIKNIFGFTHKGMTIYISSEVSWAKAQLRSGYTSVSMKMLSSDNTVLINNIYDIIDDNNSTYFFAEDGKVYKL